MSLTDTETLSKGRPAEGTPTGEAASAAEAAAREARRQRRLALVGRLLDAGEEAAMNLTEGMAGRLYGDRLEAYLRIGDPALAWSRITRTVRQLAALEERFDEDADTRAARIAAERATAERAAKAERDAQELSEVRDRTKTLVQDAIREIYRDAAPETPSPEREQLLRDLFADYAVTDDYYDDPADIVVRILRTAYLTDDGSPTDDETMEVTREEAQAYIDAIRSAGGLQPEQPQPDGQGPPE